MYRAMAFLWSLPMIATAAIPTEVRSLIPSSIEIDHPRYADAKKELEFAVKDCGPGVVEGASGPNACTYRIRLDDLFFTPLDEKTGLLHDDDWAYRDGETWYVANETTEIPESYDLRSLMTHGVPDIKAQGCGDCWAWATHHGLELARAVHDFEVFDHSVQTVLSCSKHGSCGGGYMSAPTWLIKRGLPMEPEFSYTGGKDTKCKFSSDEMTKGWTGAIWDAPNVGKSLRYSRYFAKNPKAVREGTKVQEMMAAMVQAKSPLVVTVAAYSISGNGIYNSCSSINSGGNHMVAISGFEMSGGKRIAHVWNSWGKSHGLNGVSRIQWECGDGKLNRGLGYSARVIQYRVPCAPPRITTSKGTMAVDKGQAVKIGNKMDAGTTCRWLPTVGLSDPTSCETWASPNLSTEYHLQASNTCGTTSAMRTVRVFTGGEPVSDKLLTPYGTIEED